MQRHCKELPDSQLGQSSANSKVSNFMRKLDQCVNCDIVRHISGEISGARCCITVDTGSSIISVGFGEARDLRIFGKLLDEDSHWREGTCP